MSIIITRSGKGAALTHNEMDTNLDSLSGIVEQQTGATYTVVAADQGRTVELNNASMVCTLDAIATIAAAIDTSNFRVTIVNVNAADATLNASGAETIRGVSSITLSQEEAVTVEIDATTANWRVKQINWKSTDSVLVTPTLVTPTINGTLTGTAIGRGALAYSNAGKIISTSTRTVMDFELEDYDTDTIHDNVTNNSRLTVPTGVTKIRLTAKISMAGGGGFYEARTLKNGLAAFAGSSEDGVLATASWLDVHLNLNTPVITVVATDYFEVDLFQTTGISKNTRSGSDQAWFGMEIIK